MTERTMARGMAPEPEYEPPHKSAHGQIPPDGHAVWLGGSLRRVSGVTPVGMVVRGALMTRPAHEAALSARALLAAADVEAAARVAEANRLAALAAEEHLRERERRLDAREAALETGLWSRLAAYSGALDRAWDETLDALASRTTTVVAEALSRLVAELPPEERIRACVQQLLAHPERPDIGELHVADEDLARVMAMPDLPWPVRVDRQMGAGTARLVAERGRWECDVEGALAQLLDALSDAGGRVRPPLQDNAPDEGQPAPPTPAEQGA